LKTNRLLGSGLVLVAVLGFSPALQAQVKEVQVNAVAETNSIIGDADDPAIWVNPSDPAASLVLGTDKYNGLHVFDLNGAEVAYFNDGSVNNVDLRQFTLAGRTVWLASATERDNEDIVFYVIEADGKIDRATPHAFAAKPDTTERVRNIYGHAMARDPATGRVWALTNFKTGHIVQYEVLDDNGELKLEFARMFKVASQPEGIVADDVAGHIYVGEEDTGIWRFPLLPENGDEATLIAAIPSDCFPVDDIEGLAIYDGADARYLVASAQGIHRAAIIPLQGEEVLPCAGLVEISAGPATDGVSETDGLDIVATPLGPDYPAGMLVMMDDQNEDLQTNFKYVSFAEVQRALGLK
jgi:3-phytase